MAAALGISASLCEEGIQGHIEELPQLFLNVLYI